MSQLSWNEIQKRALEFSVKWAGETYEKGESQSFWSDFLNVFGIDRKRHGAYFEYAVKKIDNRQGFIDMFWPGILLAEQKSKGRDLNAANLQAFEYLHNLTDEELPKYIVVSDFNNFELVNLETRERTSFTLSNLPKKVKLFGFVIGKESENPQEEDPVNRKAAETMARLHNQLRDSNFQGHELELLLVRLVFCMFADDAGIFERGSFENYMVRRTAVDGSDTGSKLGKIFEVLNTPTGKRQMALDEDLSSLPYVNGGLFSEITRMPDFTREMRAELVSALNLDWSLVSPAIFGSMFQSVLDEKARRDLGAHYTSERNIIKVIKALFLDELQAEFIAIKNNKRKLNEFHQKLAELKFLDPACGCGNFLVITYRELRKLEHQVLSAIHGRQSLLTDVTDNIKVNVDQMYGIEIEEFPALIAETALWLTDHQMNLAASQQFGRHYARLPLKKRANISNKNALRTEWSEIIEPSSLAYILGNPPFIGHQWRSLEQVKDMNDIWGTSGSFNRLDYVTCWFKKSAKIMVQNPKIKTGLVATNSISQGEQVSLLWESLFGQGFNIDFAHRTFKWTNEGKNKAAVHCVIIGFSKSRSQSKKLYVYESITSEPELKNVKSINGYLVEGPPIFIKSRSKTPDGMPLMTKGSQPTDGGFLLFDEEEMYRFVQSEPMAKQWIREFIGGEELMKGHKRYCLWLKDCPPTELRQMPAVLDRLEKVKESRQQSSTPSVRAFAQFPSLFTQDRQPTTEYLAMPRVSSERRKYIPIAYLNSTVIAHEKLIIIPEADLYLFGILNSQMHMAWVRVVAGRLKSDYSYSPAVYNNFVWPTNVNQSQKAIITNLAAQILETRKKYPSASLADLYDPLTMPPDLVKAHNALDLAVDNLYGSRFNSDEDRLTELFSRYANQKK